MTFHALLVSKDEEAAAVLTPLLSRCGVAVACCGYPEALCRLTEEKFDSVIVDFDDPHSASLVLQNASRGASGVKAVTVALLSDKTKVRNVFGAGANFVLYKPISTEQAEASLRAATALIKRERRRSFRVPVQVPIQLQVAEWSSARRHSARPQRRWHGPSGRPAAMPWRYHQRTVQSSRQRHRDPGQRRNRLGKSQRTSRRALHRSSRESSRHPENLGSGQRTGNSATRSRTSIAVHLDRPQCGRMLRGNRVAISRALRHYSLSERGRHGSAGRRHGAGNASRIRHGHRVRFAHHRRACAGGKVHRIPDQPSGNASRRC